MVALRHDSIEKDRGDGSEREGRSSILPLGGQSRRADLFTTRPRGPCLLPCRYARMHARTLEPTHCAACGKGDRPTRLRRVCVGRAGWDRRARILHTRPRAVGALSRRAARLPTSQPASQVLCDWAEDAARLPWRGRDDKHEEGGCCPQKKRSAGKGKGGGYHDTLVASLDRSKESGGGGGGCGYGDDHDTMASSSTSPFSRARVVSALTTTQHVSALVFGSFLFVHLAAPSVAAVAPHGGALDLSTKTMVRRWARRASAARRVT